MERPAGLREAHLCLAWERGLVDAQRLRTAAGMLLQVVYPGRRCGDAGPDFRDAVIALPDAALLHGDVEVHLDDAGWQAHGHAANPAYNRVILHLTWSGTADVVTSGGRFVPTLPLAACLAVAPEALVTLPVRGMPLGPSCPSALSAAQVDALPAFLREQGRLRLAARAAQLSADAAQAGFDQILWAGLLRCLGYHRNTAPFAHLARVVPWATAASLARRPDGAADLTALLLGAAGFLDPSAHPMPIADEERRAAWRRRWLALRAWCLDRPIGRTEWSFAGVRPDNAPPRRLAAAVGLAAYFADDLSGGLCALVVAETPSLALDIPEDEYWRGHSDLGRSVGPRPVSVLGPSRERELLVNAVLPGVLALAYHIRDRGLEQAVLRRYERLAAAGPNQITRHMLQTINAPTRLVTSAAMEQGLLHLYHSWCRERRCWQCSLPAAFPAATMAPDLGEAEGASP